MDLCIVGLVLLAKEKMQTKLCWLKTEQLKTICTAPSASTELQQLGMDTKIRYYFIQLIWPHKFHYCEPECPICQNRILIILSKTSPTISNVASVVFPS